MINIVINDRKLTLHKPMTVLDAARANNIMIPHFCDHPLLEKFAGCRMCLVEVEGMKRLQASCALMVSEGMVIKTESPGVISARKSVLEFLLINHPLDCPTCDKAGECKLQDYSVMYGPGVGRFEETKFKEAESTTDPLIVRNMERCIVCTRCVRACTQVQGASAISVVGKGKESFIEPFTKGRFDCDYCGTCITVCPVGSLMSKLHRHNYRPWETTKTINTICPFCGVGCSLTVQMRENSIQRVTPKYRAGVNEGILCARGYFGYEYATSPERLTAPLIRKNGALVPATFEEALSYTAQRLMEISRTHGPASVGAIASVRCTNEDNYLLQKFMRLGLGSDNIDSTARLGLAATRETFDALLGPGSTASPLYGIKNSKAIIVMGGDPTGEAPVLGVRIRNARMKGAEVIAMGPAPGLSAHTSIPIGATPDSEGHAIAAMLAIILEGRTPGKGNEDMERLMASIKLPSPEDLGGICDISALRRAADILTNAGTVSIVVGRGLAAHEHGTRNLAVAAALAHVLEALVYVSSEGPNENGAIDMGCAPGTLPGGAALDDRETRLRYEEAFDRKLPDTAGLTLMEMTGAAESGQMKAMYIMGENPAFNLASNKRVASALENLEFLVVQDIFTTETSELAHVVLPASGWPEKNGTFTNLERRIQVLHRAITAGKGMEDWKILSELCRMAGMDDGYESSEDVFDEISKISPLHGQLHYSAIMEGRDMFPYGSKSLPDAPAPSEPLMAEAAMLSPIPEPMDLYPALHKPLFHSGTLTRHSDALRELMSEPLALISPHTAKILSLHEGQQCIASTEKGQIRVKISIDKIVPNKVVFISNNFKSSGLFGLTEYIINPITKTPYLEAIAINLKKGG